MVADSDSTKGFLRAIAEYFQGRAVNAPDELPGTSPTASSFSGVTDGDTLAKIDFTSQVNPLGDPVAQLANIYKKGLSKPGQAERPDQHGGPLAKTRADISGFDVLDPLGEDDPDENASLENDDQVAQEIEPTEFVEGSIVQADSTDEAELPEQNLQGPEPKQPEVARKDNSESYESLAAELAEVKAALNKLIRMEKVGIAELLAAANVSEFEDQEDEEEEDSGGSSDDTPRRPEYKEAKRPEFLPKDGFSAKLTAETSGAYTWSEVRLDSSGDWETFTGGRSGTLNAKEYNGLKDIADDTYVWMWKEEDWGGDITYRFACGFIDGVTAGALDATYAGEHAELARAAGTAWTRSASSVGYKTSLVTGEAYYHTGDEKWYEYRIDHTFDSHGKLAVASAEYKVEVDEPVDCPNDVDGGTV